MMILVTIICYFAVLLLIARITGYKGGSNAALLKGENKSPWYVVYFWHDYRRLYFRSDLRFCSGMVRGMDMTYMQTVFGFFIRIYGGSAYIASLIL